VRGVGTLQVAALDAFARGTHRREHSRFLVRLVALHEGDAKLTGGVAWLSSSPRRDRRPINETSMSRSLPSAPRLSGETAISAPVPSSSRASRCCFAVAPRPAQLLIPIASCSPSRSGSLSTNSSVESVARLAATERRLGAEALRTEDEGPDPCVVPLRPCRSAGPGRRSGPVLCATSRRSRSRWSASRSRRADRTLRPSLVAKCDSRDWQSIAWTVPRCRCAPPCRTGRARHRGASCYANSTARHRPDNARGARSAGANSSTTSSGPTAGPPLDVVTGKSVQNPDRVAGVGVEDGRHRRLARRPPPSTMSPIMLGRVGRATDPAVMGIGCGRLSSTALAESIER